jgi:hypothetical protein
MERNAPVAAVLKVAAVAAVFIALVAFVARGVFPGTTIGEIIAIIVGVLIVGGALLAGGMVASLQFSQWLLRRGGIDPQWLWFKSDPPGLRRMHEDERL